MTGWLPKEILDHLEHAGYVAIPKDRVVNLHSDVEVDLMFLSMTSYDLDVPAQLKKDAAYRLGMEALKSGYIALERVTMEERQTLKMRATLTVLKPKVIT